MRIFWAVLLVLLFPVQVMATGWVQPVQYSWIGCKFMTSGHCYNHLGIDWGNSIGTNVKAIAKVYEVRTLTPAGFGGCDGTPGNLLMLKHRKANGAYFWALYGHIQNMQPNLPINAGDVIAELAQYSPCYHSDDCRTPGCPHLHFGIWDDPSVPTAFYGYGTQRFYTDPVQFLANESPYPEEEYTCQYGRQSPNIEILGKPGDVKSFWVKFKNVGSATWVNSGGVGEPQYVELHSVHSNGADKICWLKPVDWVGCPQNCNTIRVKSFESQSVAPGDSAKFSFQAKIPNVGSTTEIVYFRPFHGSGIPMDNWGGMNFFIRVDADAPQAPPGLSVNPTGCSTTNSFTFSWGQSSDTGGSGIRRYQWKVNGGAETTTTSLSVSGVSVNNQGTHTFRVRAEDWVGNFSDYSPVNFCWQTNTGPNLSFDYDDSPSDGIPDGWSTLNVNGAQYSLLSGGIAGTHYVSFTHTDANDWSAIGRSASGIITANQTYRLGFWYRTHSASPFGWRLSTSDLGTSSADIVGGPVGHPLSDGGWHWFQGAPFSVSSSDLSQHPYLSFYYDYNYNTNGTVDIDGVTVEEVSLCQ